MTVAPDAFGELNGAGSDGGTSASEEENAIEWFGSLRTGGVKLERKDF